MKHVSDEAWYTKFDTSVNFGLWQFKIKSILIQNGMQKEIDGVEKMLEVMTVTRLEEINTKALMTIQQCLSTDLLREVVKETTTKGI